MSQGTGGAAKDAAEQAFAFLRRTFACGPGREIAPKDPYLRALRNHPAFVALPAGKSQAPGAKPSG